MVIAQFASGVNVFTEAQPRRYKALRGGSCVPVCLVVCRISRQQLWFILYSQRRGPLSLTGKVKAYSLEAVLQRSTRSLGMRNRTTERKTEKKCTPLISSGRSHAFDILQTHPSYCLQQRHGSIYPLVLSIPSPLPPPVLLLLRFLLSPLPCDTSNIESCKKQLTLTKPSPEMVHWEGKKRGRAV